MPFPLHPRDARANSWYIFHFFRNKTAQQLTHCPATVLWLRGHRATKPKHHLKRGLQTRVGNVELGAKCGIVSENTCMWLCIQTCVVGHVQLRECDCRLQDVEAANGRISTASLNSYVQIKCQICILVLCFQACYAAAGRKQIMGGGIQIATSLLRALQSQAREILGRTRD